MSSRRVAFCCLLVACATCAYAQTEWTLDPEAPVLEPAPPGAWDFGMRLIEAVIEVDGVYHMFYRAASEDLDFWGSDAIGHATSTDGVTWTLDPANPVLSPGPESEWDHAKIRGAAVIHDGSRFRMWYAAVTPPEPYWGMGGLWHGIGYATSTDGFTWSKSVDNPIIAPGANGTFAVPQTVIFDGEGYRMWYTASFHSGGESAGSAWSEDGMSWSGFSFEAPAREKSEGLTVVFDGTRYLMMRWYVAGYTDPFISGAASSNGNSWMNFARDPVISWASSPAVLLDGDALVMWYSSYDGIHRATSACCDTTYTWFLLAAAHGAGAMNSFYRTEVEINNAGEDRADYNFVWFPRDRDNSEWIRSQRFQIEPGASVRYADVLPEVFGLGPDSFGALGVESTSADVLAVGRISTTDDQAAGAYGQTIPVVRADEFYSLGWGQRILLGTESDDERFNITCFFGRDWWIPRDVMLDLFDADGTLLETRSLTLQSFGSGQINRVFGDHRPVDGYVQVGYGWNTYCFGSRIDNRTNDPTTIMPR